MKISVCLQVRTPAAELLSGLTGSVEGSQKLQQHRGVLLPALQRLVAERDGSGKAALTALVNLSQVSHRAGLGLPAGRQSNLSSLNHAMEESLRLLKVIASPLL